VSKRKKIRNKDYRMQGDTAKTRAAYQHFLNHRETPTLTFLSHGCQIRIRKTTICSLIAAAVRAKISKATKARWTKFRADKAKYQSKSLLAFTSSEPFLVCSQVAPKKFSANPAHWK
jgi:hypothetical protein